MDELSCRIDRLESIESIKQLKAKYCEYCDDNYRPEDIASMFVENGVWDGGETYGRHVGREEIKAFFSEVSKDISFAGHLVMNPIIEVDGDTAIGRWRLLMPATVKGQAVWQLVSYQDEYVRVDGKWMYSFLKVDVQFLTPYDKGWAVQQFLS
jgi:hypothetical protein